MIPKLEVTIKVSLEGAQLLRDLLRPKMMPTAWDGPTEWYLRDHLREVYEGLCRDLPPVNARLAEPIRSYYGSSGR